MVRSTKISSLHPGFILIARDYIGERLARQAVSEVKKVRNIIVTPISDRIGSTETESGTSTAETCPTPPPPPIVSIVYHALSINAWTGGLHPVTRVVESDIFPSNH